MPSGVRVDQLRELGENLNDLVGPLSAGRHDYDVSLTLLGDSVLENSLSASERTGNESRTSFGDRVERVYAPDPGLHNLLGPGFFLVGLDRYLDRPFLGHCDVTALTGIVDKHRYDHVDIVTT